MHKTRIVKLSEKEFVPQFFQKHFPWGGSWEGIEKRDAYTFYRYSNEVTQLHRCVVDTEKEAEEVLTSFNTYCANLTLLTSG
jgi:hypothetical protein